MESIQKAIVSSLAGGSSASSAHGPASDGTPTSSLVSRILQVALGLFVTTVDLPSLGPDLQSNPSIGFDCDFSMPCRWTSVGNSVDKWKLARGEPDSILWLAATGTMVQPVEPFSLLESRDGRLGEMLTSELVTCQDGPSMLSFTYWTVGNSDLEICLLDADFNRFNCTGMLQTHVQPGKVALRIPPVEKSFHIAIIPNREQGVLVVDDIKFDARSCQDRHRGMVLSTRSSPSPLPSHVWTINSQTALPITTATFLSPPPLLGPVSTASPLPLPFSPGPSLPMGPLILPPLLPGPTAGIVNPFVVAPLIPPTTSFAGLLTAPSPAPRTDSTSATTSSPSPPLAIIVTAGYTKKASTMAESSTEEEEEEAEEEEEQEKSSTERQSTETRRMPSTTESPIFTSTIISARTRSKFVPATATRRTKMPTGFPNIGIGTTTVKPLPSFDLLIVGNRTRPFFDRRLGKITEQTEDLLCDFANNFPCLWGPEAGRWAVVDKGAIPSLDEQYSSSEEEDESPNYPAAVVIQGTAMLSSDPLRCQSGEGKLLFRYWTNGRVLVQVCAMGWAVDSAKIQCVEEVADHNRMDPSSLAIFELPDPIREPFTLNLVPIWEKNAHNNYLLIDEIAYIGECNLTALNEIDEVESHREIGTGRRVEVPGPGTAGQAGITLLPPPVPFIPPHFTLRPASPPTKYTITTTSATTSTTSTTTMTPMTTTTTTTTMEITTTISAATPSPQPPPTTITTTKASSSVEVEDLITPLLTLPPPSSSAPPISRSTVRPVRPRTRRPLVISPPIVQPPATGQHLTRPPPRPPMPRRPVPVETASWLSTTRRPGTRYPFYPSTPTVPNQRLTTPPWGPSRELPTGTIDWITSAKPTEEFSGEELGGGGGGAVSTIYPGIDPVKKKRPSAGTTLDSFTIPYTTTQRYKPTTPPVELNYCKLLNCDFNENACHYLNHGLTRVPWTLRTKGYGFPLNRNTDLRPTAANGQFVSCVLGPGDFGILESPRFNLTDGINVLLFQYFRPTHSSTIRLCLGTRYTKPLRTVSAFLQCPPILRSVTSKNTPKWNSVHIQLPPGTSHFYLVAHNLDRSAEKTAIAIDNIRVAICDPRATYDPEDPDLTESDRRMLVPSIRKATAIVDSRELYEDLTEVNEEDTDRL